MTLPGRRITSRDNPVFREALALTQSARERRRLGRSILEGIHLCQAWLERPEPPLLALVSTSARAHPEVAALLMRLPGAPVELSDALFGSLSTLQAGVGVALVVNTPRPELPARIDADAVYLDRLQDPGNVGTMLRTCAAAGIGRVITAPGTAWCWSPKVLRAGMGAHVHLSIHEAVPWAALRERLGSLVVGTRARSAACLFETDLRAPTVWVMGNEGEGVCDAIARDVQCWVRIPQAPAVESLNVAAAAAVCLFEQRRQRR